MNLEIVLFSKFFPETMTEMLPLQRKHKVAFMEGEVYRRFVESAPVGIYEIKFNPPRFVWVNEETCRILGYTKEELLKMNLLDLMDEEGRRRFLERFKRVLAGEKVDSSVEYKFKTKDGRELWVGLHSTFTYNNDVVDGALVVAEDVTERKKIEEALRKSENRLAVAVKATGLGIYEHHVPLGEECYHSERWAEILGYKLTELPAPEKRLEWVFAQTHPDDRAAVQAEMNRALDPEKGTFYAEYRVINRKDKTVRWVYATGKTFFDDNHNAVRLIGTAEDITERKKTEEALWQQAQLLHLSYDAIIVWRKDGGIEHWNRGAEQLYGYTESEALGRVTHKLLKTIPPVPWPEIEAAMRKHGQWEGELRHHAKDGREVTVSARHQLVLGTDGVERILETNRDITERKKAEEALRKSEEQLRRAIEDAPIPVIMHAEDGEVLQISRSWTELTGYTINQIRSFDEWVTEAVYGEGADKIRDHLHELFKGAKRSVNEEFAIRTIHGEERFWSFSASSPGALADGRRYIVGMAVDITERKKAEDALVSSEKRYRRLFETSQDGIMARDLNGCMIDCNQAYTKMVGYSKEELLRLPVEELLPEKWHKQRNRIFREVLETGGSAVFEREYRRKDGVVFPASVRSWRLIDENGEIMASGQLCGILRGGKSWSTNCMIILRTWRNWLRSALCS
jgi:PAS domain S-box-containing protein